MKRKGAIKRTTNVKRLILRMGRKEFISQALVVLA